MEQLSLAEKDVIADMGEEVLEQGGYADLVRAIATNCTPLVEWELSLRTGVDIF